MNDDLEQWFVWVSVQKKRQTSGQADTMLHPHIAAQFGKFNFASGGFCSAKHLCRIGDTFNGTSRKIFVAVDISVRKIVNRLKTGFQSSFFDQLHKAAS